MTLAPVLKVNEGFPTEHKYGRQSRASIMNKKIILIIVYFIVSRSLYEQLSRLSKCRAAAGTAGGGWRHVSNVTHLPVCLAPLSAIASFRHLPAMGKAEAFGEAFCLQKQQSKEKRKKLSPH